MIRKYPIYNCNNPYNGYNNKSEKKEKIENKKEKEEELPPQKNEKKHGLPFEITIEDLILLGIIFLLLTNKEDEKEQDTFLVLALVYLLLCPNLNFGDITKNIKSLLQ